MIARTSRVQIHAGQMGIIHDSTNNSTKAGGTRLRRRLSRIFQRDNADSEFLMRPPNGLGVQGDAHIAICQSPRIQRCRRPASTWYRAGYVSYSWISLIKAERAWQPSKRS